MTSPAARAGRPPMRTTALLALAIVCGTVFVGAAFLALSGSEIPEIDRAGILAFRTPGDLAVIAGPAWFAALMRDVTALGGTPFLTLLTAILIGYLGLRRRWASVALLVAVVIGQALAIDWLKAAFDRPRPDLAPRLVEVSSKSFPSGHAASAASIYLFLAVMLAPSLASRAARIYALVCAIVLAFLVGASRIVLGAHYPTDVLAGWSFGVTWTALVLIAARRIGLL